MPEPAVPAQAAHPEEPPPGSASSPEELAWARRWTRVALALLVASLFVPWWMAIDRVTGGVILPPDWLGLGLFAPAWSPFVLSPLGTKLSSHFWNLLVLLVAALSLLALAWAHLGRPRWSARLLWGAAAFTGVGLLLFSVFFPRVGYAGRIFWPAGSGEFAGIGGREVALTWSLLPGWILVALSLSLQIRVAVRLTRSHSVPEPRSEGTKAAPPARLGRDKATQVIVVPMSFAILAAAIWGASAYSPLITAEGLQNDWDDFSHKSFEPGDRALVRGSVTGVRFVSTSYGPFTLLALDSAAGVQVALAGDQRSRYPVGSAVWIPLHFRAYTYNGIPFTWADEGGAPVALLTSFAVVIGAVSNVMGVPLVPETPILGSTRLVVRTAYGFPVGEFRAALAQGGVPYLSETAAMSARWPPPNLVDLMVPLADSTSENGTFAFVDENSNGLLDWGDAFDIELPATARDTEFRSYVLVLRGPLEGVAYVPLGQRGPFFVDFSGLDPARLELHLAMPPDVWNETTCDSRIVVSRRIGPVADPVGLRARLEDWNTSEAWELPAKANASLPDAAFVQFVDGGELGVLDEGDEWRFYNLAPYHTYYFGISGGGDRSPGGAGWVCGVGRNIGSYPRVTTSLDWLPTVKTAQINVTNVEWVPAASVDSYRVLLRKNGTGILPADGEAYVLVRNSVTSIGPSADVAGTVLKFTDANIYFGPGDWFTVENCAPGSTYELLLYYGYASTLVADVTWTT
jgi:hypothetical protein